MTRRIEWRILTTFCLLVLIAGCHQANPAKATWVDQKDSSRVLVMESASSLKVKLFGRFHNVSEMGTYELTTKEGTTRGTFTYSPPEKNGKKEYKFRSDDGKANWTAEIKNFSLTKQPEGSSWGIQKVDHKVAELAPVLKQTGN